MEAGVDGIVVLGLATEAAKLTEAEQRSVIAWATEDVAGRVPLGVTVYGNSIVAQLELLRTAEHAGADWLILQPPAIGTLQRRAVARLRAPRRRGHGAGRDPERAGADGAGPGC